MARRAFVGGAGGFIGGHLVRRLKDEGYYVEGADIKEHEFSTSVADKFHVLDLRSQLGCDRLFREGHFDEVYQLAADMGGAGYIFSGENDANVMHNSASINLNVAHLCHEYQVDKVFYSSSACIYPQELQTDAINEGLKEATAYPAHPDSEYGWEKLFSERLYMSFYRNFGLKVYIARFHNIFGPQGTWKGGKEKAPAAVCRKVAEAEPGSTIEIWGDGKQTRTFLYIDECIEGIRRLVQSDHHEPINLGSDELISINDLAKMVMKIAKKPLELNHIEGPLGVRGRSSNNELIQQVIGWRPQKPLEYGMEKTFSWINKQVHPISV